jgi:hypothetical protein
LEQCTPRILRIQFSCTRAAQKQGVCRQAPCKHLNADAHNPSHHTAAQDCSNVPGPNVEGGRRRSKSGRRTRRGGIDDATQTEPKAGNGQRQERPPEAAAGTEETLETTTWTLDGRTHPRTSKRRSGGDNTSGSEIKPGLGAYPKLSSRSSLSIDVRVVVAITVRWYLLAWMPQREGEKRGRIGTLCGSVRGRSSWGGHLQSWMKVICAS